MSATSAYQGGPIHTDKLLANFALSYTNNKLIADVLSPIVPVDEVSGKYAVHGKENTMRYAGKAVIGPTSDIPETGGSNSEQTYSCRGRGRKSPISLRTAAASDPSLQVRQRAVTNATAQLALEREVIVRDLLFNAANYKATTNTAAISTKWNAKTGGVSDADPITDVELLKPNIFRAPNTKLVAGCGTDVWTALKQNTKVRDRFVGGATTAMPAHLLKTLFAELLEVDEFVVGDAWAMSPAGVLTRVWNGGHFGVWAVPESAGLDSMCFSLSPRWTAPGPGGFKHMQEIVMKGTMGVEYHSITCEDDEVICANDAAILLTGVIP